MVGLKVKRVFTGWCGSLRLIQMRVDIPVLPPVGVYPVVDDNIDITVEDKDIRVDTYRASGAGGQHVNRTDSAVRILYSD